MIGDLAALEQDGAPVPGVAPGRMQKGRYVARELARALGGEPREPFRYRDKGTLATIGRSAARSPTWARCGSRGFVAWLVWLGVHIFFLIGFRNRLVVMLDWAWAYVTYDRGARLILGRGRDAAAGDA